jgi:hypothetical protein
MSNPEEWPDDFDAVVAAPQHHRVLFENEVVRVLETKVSPGETTPLHTHRWPGSQYLLSWSDFLRCDAEGTVLLDTRTIDRPQEGAAFWSPSIAPHTLENIGASDLRVISVELKNL